MSRKQNPNPKHLVTLDPERLSLLTRIRQKCVLPNHEIDPKMIADTWDKTPSYVRQILGRQCYTSLAKLQELESVIDSILISQGVAA